jgi:phage/conjugal plasmid C-4 type zinc finger TraR family protein
MDFLTVQRHAKRKCSATSSPISAGAPRLDGKTVDDSAHICIDCDEPIPQARREAYPGLQRCVECQAPKQKKHWN